MPEAPRSSPCRRMGRGRTSMPRSASATTDRALACARVSCVPSRGRGVSTWADCGPRSALRVEHRRLVLLPLRSPAFRPSGPPALKRIASTAAWSADSLSPRPTQRAAASAAASVTRTSSRRVAIRRGGVAQVVWPWGCHASRAQPSRLSLERARRLASPPPRRIWLMAPPPRCRARPAGRGTSRCRATRIRASRRRGRSGRCRGSASPRRRDHRQLAGGPGQLVRRE